MRKPGERRGVSPPWARASVGLVAVHGGLTPRRSPYTAGFLQSSLSMPSLALVFQLGAKDKSNLLYRLGVLDAQTLGEIRALIHQLAL